MRLPLSILVVPVMVANGFTFCPKAPFVSRPFDRTSVIVSDSRRRQKKKTRREFAEKRGLFFDKEGKPYEKAGTFKNKKGLEYVKLVHPTSKCSAEVYPFGGVVTSYKDKDGYEFIAIRPDAKTDGSKPISGGLSHCWPQFGPGEIQQHGFARNVNWRIKDQTDTEVVMQLAPSDYTRGIWDKEFLCTFTVTIEEEQLTTKMVVENTGEESWDFQAALHSYLKISSLEETEISGSFEGKEFLNKMVGDGGEMQTEDRSVISISEEYDRVYKGVNDPVLKDEGRNKTLEILNTEGWEDTVIWNPYGNEAMGYDEFVCVESVKFDPVSLEGNASWTGVMALKATGGGIPPVEEPYPETDLPGGWIEMPYMPALLERRKKEEAERKRLEELDDGSLYKKKPPQRNWKRW